MWRTGRRQWRADFRSEWPEYGIPELDRVSRALGAANTEIAMRLDREGGIVGEVSHQLRSRLTAIQLRLDELALHADQNVVAEAEAAASQVDRLTRELDEMVVASRTSEATPASAVDIGPMVVTLVADFAPAFAAAGRRVQIVARLRAGHRVDRSAQPAAGGARGAAGQRAAPRSRPGHRDRRCVGVCGDAAVADHRRRAWVPDDLVDKIFRRGFTGGVSTGTGVGLSLARALVETDGGRLELTSRHPVEFSIVVPAVAPTTALRRGRVPHR